MVLVATRSTSRGANHAGAWETIRPSQLYWWSGTAFFWLDLVIFIEFVLTAFTGLLLWLVIPGGQQSGNLVFLALTRRDWITLHDWAGAMMLASVLLHLALHWKWILCVARRFFHQTSPSARLNFSLDALLFAAFAIASVSGLVP